MEGSGYGRSKYIRIRIRNKMSRIRNTACNSKRKSGSLRRQRPGKLQESVTYSILSEHRYLRKVSEPGLELISLIDDVFRGDVQDVHLSVLYRLEHLKEKSRAEEHTIFRHENNGTDCKRNRRGGGGTNRKVVFPMRNTVFATTDLNAGPHWAFFGGTRKALLVCSKHPLAKGEAL
jgi:hypothetical protein